MNNNLVRIQEMLMREMERLSENSIEPSEIARGNALSQNALTYIKTINASIRVMEISDKYGITKDELNKQLGIEYEK